MNQNSNGGTNKKWRMARKGEGDVEIHVSHFFFRKNLNFGVLCLHNSFVFKLKYIIKCKSEL